MNEKLVINTNLLRKESEFRTRTCVVEKAIAVPHTEFEKLKREPLKDNDLIADNIDLMYCDSDDNYHCLLIYDEEYGDGLVAEPEGSNYLNMRGIFRTQSCCMKIIFRRTLMKCDYAVPWIYISILRIICLSAVSLITKRWQNMRIRLIRVSRKTICPKNVSVVLCIDIT